MAQNSTINDPVRVSSDDKISPESLNLRAKPKPVTRLNRRVLIGLSGTGLMLILPRPIMPYNLPLLAKLKTKNSIIPPIGNNPNSLLPCLRPTRITPHPT